MAWFRRKPPAPFAVDYQCWRCKAHYTAPTIEAIAELGRDHQAQCAGYDNAGIGIISVAGEITPAMAAAIRQTWKTTLS